jgi:hypothetical protein
VHAKLYFREFSYDFVDRIYSSCSGVFHWLEDSYGDPRCPVLGLYVTRPNILHHFDPRHFVRTNTWFGRIRTLAILAVLFISLANIFHFLSWQFLLCIVVMVNANEIHKWSHCSAFENGSLITALQSIGILQSSAQHARHHKGGKNTHYCVITNYLNPILEFVSFWRMLELALLLVLRIDKRPDPTLRSARRLVNQRLRAHIVR